ncbi:serine hydrolase domain-containing protein [Actinomadura rugatobispora]|uniref:Serine hydrolase domain-containing protein n=1 Tax=Actinomadura rugatobispora TaxID=1994 RepID=A0ABW1A3H8_9ACTN|nr:hypothetical protein GCM10010200_003070 [Actinomadura rugatobispora]
MVDEPLNRRDFGRLLGLAGLGAAAGPALLAGCGTASGTATRAGAAAARTWKVTGTAGAGLGGFDTAVKKLMQDRGIPCGSLAVMRKGRLLHARGYTWSDDTSFTTQPTSLFRLASLSKAVTAAAVTRLVQDGRLSLSASVTSLLTLTPPPGQTLDPRLPQVTVRRLLQHLGGWDRDISGDPTYRDRQIAAQLGVPLPITRAHLVRHGAGLRLEHDPGSAFAYSNHGYLLLGEIVAKVSGMSYADYVQRNVFAPAGVTRARPGRSLKSGRAPGEVPYFSQETGRSVFDAAGTTVPGPYGTFNAENRIATGTWLASAVDYVRFTRIFDATTSVLTASSVAAVFAKPETGLNSGGSYYGFGWHVRDVAGGRNTWHSGSLPGTSTIVTRRYDGVTWALLFDQRDDPSAFTYTYDDFSAPLHKVANGIGTWPATDLWSRYL